MNMKEKNAKKSKIHQLGFSFLKRESNYLDRQRQAILVCFSVMLSLGILSNILGFSGAFDPFFTVSNIVFPYTTLFRSFRLSCYPPSWLISSGKSQW